MKKKIFTSFITILILFSFSGCRQSQLDRIADKVIDKTVDKLLDKIF